MQSSRHTRHACEMWVDSQTPHQRLNAKRMCLLSHLTFKPNIHYSNNSDYYSKQENHQHIHPRILVTKNLFYTHYKIENIHNRILSFTDLIFKNTLRTLLPDVTWRDIFFSTIFLQFFASFVECLIILFHLPRQTRCHPL